MKPSTCAASVAERVRPPRHRDDLDARADRRRSRSTPSPRARCPRRSARGARRARRWPAAAAQPLPHVDRLVAVHAQQRRAAARTPRAVTAPGVHVDVVRGPHRRQHLALAIADLPAHRRQHLGADDAVGGDAEEDVALDDLQVEQPPRDGDEARPARRARSSAPAAVSPGARRPARLSPSVHLRSGIDIVIDARRRRAGRGPGRRASARVSTRPSSRRNSASTSGPTIAGQQRLERRLAQAAVAALGRDLGAHEHDQERRQQAGDERRRRRPARCR